MTKHKYNQGDLVQYKATPDSRESQLILITDVFTKERMASHPDASHMRSADPETLYYNTLWLGTKVKRVYAIQGLDDNGHITLVARGSKDNP